MSTSPSGAGARDTLEVDAATHAARIYAAAGHSLGAPPGPAALAIRLMGRGSFNYRPLAAGDEFEIVPDPWRLSLPLEMPLRQRTIATARGVALWWIVTGNATARPGLVEAIALEVVLPVAAIARYGGDVDKIARTFIVPTAAVRARLGARGPNVIDLAEWRARKHEN